MKQRLMGLPPMIIGLRESVCGVEEQDVLALSWCRNHWIVALVMVLLITGVSGGMALFCLAL